MTPTKMILPAIFVCILICATYRADDVIYPEMHAGQQLATQIHCQVGETQQFRYASVSTLWGTAGGDILLNANITLRCLGDDTGGTYESEALKYQAQISNLLIEPMTKNETKSIGKENSAADGTDNSSEKTKKFFKGRVQTTVGNKDDEEEEFNSTEAQQLYSVPFQFVQLANGTIPEIRFAENEVNNSNVKNFKRHLVDSFATHLDFDQKEKVVAESSAIGKHLSSYYITTNKRPTTFHIAKDEILETGEPILLVSKIVTGKDILDLAPSNALNDLQKTDLKMQQQQVFQDGKLISSSGTSFLNILASPDIERTRIKREDGDVLSYFRAHSSFDLQLYESQNCTVEHCLQEGDQDSTIYLAASRFAEMDESPEIERLISFQKAVGDVTEVIQRLVNKQETNFHEKMQLMFDMVAKEVSLKLDRESNSASNAVRKVLTKKKMVDMCAKDFSFCKDFLQLLAFAGGAEAEYVLLSFLSEQSNLTSTEIRIVVDILSDVSRPSRELLDSLDKLISENMLKPELLGSVCLTAASIGFKFEQTEKSGIAKTLVKLLRSKIEACHSDHLVLDILEAIGNLGSKQTVQTVLKVSLKCKNISAVQIACTHALRHFVHLPSVQKWMQNRIKSGSCDLMEEVVATLFEKIQDQEKQRDAAIWPRYGFNEVDETLERKLFASSCSPQSCVLYFSRKKNAEANDIAENFKLKYQPNNVTSSTGQMSAFGDALSCKEWEYDSQYPQIQTNSEFESDKEIYNKRRSCLIDKKLGVKNANAEMYAGMFAGQKSPSNTSEFKIFTKLAFGINFLQDHIEIGSFYFYLHNGMPKTYVRIMGQTREKFTNNDVCSLISNLLEYSYQQHIPLYQLYIYAIQVSFGIELKIKLSLNVGCAGKEAIWEPKAELRAAGEAMGTIAFIRAGINLGGNFNYKLQFNFTQQPNICVRGNHGYDPMSVSIETWFQIWRLFGGCWGGRWTWKPGFLSWNVKDGYIQPMFAESCLKK